MMLELRSFSSGLPLNYLFAVRQRLPSAFVILTSWLHSLASPLTVAVNTFAAPPRLSAIYDSETETEVQLLFFNSLLFELNLS